MEEINTKSVIILVLFILLFYSFYSHHYQGLEPFRNIPIESMKEYTPLTTNIDIDSLDKKVPITIPNVPLLNEYYDTLKNKYNSLFSDYYNKKVHHNPIFESNINDLNIKLKNIDNTSNNYHLQVKENPSINRYKCLTNSKYNKYYLDDCKRLDSKQYFQLNRINNHQEYLKELDKGTLQDLKNLEKENKLVYPFHLIKAKRTNNCLTNYNVSPCGESKGSLKIESCIPKKSKNQQWLLDGVD